MQVLMRQRRDELQIRMDEIFRHCKATIRLEDKSGIIKTKNYGKKDKRLFPILFTVCLEILKPIIVKVMESRRPIHSLIFMGKQICFGVRFLGSLHRMTEKHLSLEIGTRNYMKKNLDICNKHQEALQIIIKNVHLIQQKRYVAEKPCEYSASEN